MGHVTVCGTEVPHTYLSPCNRGVGESAQSPAARSEEISLNTYHDSKQQTGRQSGALYKWLLSQIKEQSSTELKGLLDRGGLPATKTCRDNVSCDWRPKSVTCGLHGHDSTVQASCLAASSSESKLLFSQLVTLFLLSISHVCSELAWAIWQYCLWFLGINIRSIPIVRRGGVKNAKLQAHGHMTDGASSPRKPLHPHVADKQT